MGEVPLGLGNALSPRGAGTQRPCPSSLRYSCLSLQPHAVGSPDIVRSVRNLDFYVKAPKFSFVAIYSRKEKENTMHRLLRPILFLGLPFAASKTVWNGKKEEYLMEVKGQTGNNK